LDISETRLASVATDGEGIDVSALARLGEKAKVVYVTPAHQDPLGTTMTTIRRRALLSWADDTEGWILEGDYDSAFRYSRPVEGALQGVDRMGRVIYLGTFSNVLFPSIRLGYVVVPRGLMGRFTQIRENFDGYSPTLYQRVLTDFLREGHFARHLRRMQRLYAARREALLRALHQRAGDVLSVGSAEAGLHVVAFLRDGVDDTEVVKLAGDAGLFPEALSTFYATGSPRRGLILGFGGSDECTLASAVVTLGGLIRRMMWKMDSKRVAAARV
jgi:GntR family transcriptional regulator/MocR family aminotransferase